MGGIGSGRYPRLDTKANTDQVKRIDVRYLHQQGMLKPGAQGQLFWSCNGRPTGDIRYHTHQDHLALNYRYRPAGGLEWQPVSQNIQFDRTACHYGGERTWLLCPRCSRRVAVVYGNGKLFLCRHCHQLPYESQQLDRLCRTIEQKHKLGRRLFAYYEYGDGWGKKKGMHWKTFNRLLDQYCKLETDYHHQLAERFPELTGYV